MASSSPPNLTAIPPARLLTAHGAPATAARAQRNERLYLFLKRLFDIIASLTALIYLSPLLLLFALLIKLDSPGPVIFRQQRVGFDPRTGRPRPFTFYKFRSMYHNADSAVHRAHMRELIKNGVGPSSERPSVKLQGDRRITRFGRVLRMTSLDELPQLWNVLKGDMSLVGPRPALPYEVELYEDWHWRRLQAVPGITGWWQVRGRCLVSFDEMVRMDIEYIENRSLTLDLKVLLLTPLAVLSGRVAG